MYLIFALPDTVFCESSLPRSAQDKQRRAKKTFEEMMTYIPGIHSLPPASVLQFTRHLAADMSTFPRDKCADVKTSGPFHVSAGKFTNHLSLDFLGKCIGEEAKYEGVRLLFDGLQQPVLNKQVQPHTHTPFTPGIKVQ